MEGCLTAILEKFNPIEVIRAVEEHKVDILNVVPSILSVLIRLPDKKPLSSIRIILCGASHLSEDLVDPFLSAFPNITHILRGYGMTEAVCLSHISSFKDSKIGSCGKPLPGFEVKLVNNSENDNSEDEESGELWLKSDAIMKSYKDHNALDGNGWYHTGDILKVDSDGFYYVNGRIKDMIKVNGLQVFPVELEELLLTNSEVNECVVIGLEDDRSGQVPAAFVGIVSTANI
ncbi:hypothetical protein WR25_20684 [Diploscapter pachys]|uniref:AMP-dependent synthetase/ligase domain-containing protein n=1 Tax=Diploscapter pachys TaxID=2018661 RepID=A0A2A2J527_9BILA|nr:hypothetical protein WR25_20684 [Diploscapter pachys]